MVGRGRGRGRGALEDQQTEMAEMRRMIEDLTRAVQALQGQERRGAPDGDPNPSEDELESNPEEEQDVDNPFHEVAGDGERPNRNGLEERLVRALDFSGGGIKIEVSDFYGQMHAEDYLDWEVSLENY